MKTIVSKIDATGTKYTARAGKLVSFTELDGGIVQCDMEYDYSNAQGKHIKESKVYLYNEEAQNFLKVKPEAGTWITFKTTEAVDANGQVIEGSFIGWTFKVYGGVLRLEGKDNKAESLSDKDTDVIEGTVFYVGEKKSQKGNKGASVGISYPYGKDENGEMQYRSVFATFWNSPNARDNKDKYKANDILNPERKNKDGQMIPNPLCLAPVDNGDGTTTKKRIIANVGNLSSFTYGPNSDKAGETGYSYGCAGNYIVVGEVTSQKKTGESAAIPATPATPAAPATPVAPAMPQAPQTADDDDFVKIDPAKTGDLPFFNVQ